MTNREVAVEYLEHFCGGNVDGIASLLADDLDFKGPFHQFSSSVDYLQRLRDAPPAQVAYRVLGVTEGENSVSIYYDYQKERGALTVAQLFGFRDGKISSILLVFDTRGFA